MSVLYHRKCGGIVGAGAMVSINIVTFGVSDRTLLPGSSEIRSAAGGRIQSGEGLPVKFYCTKCNLPLPGPTEMAAEIEILCQICGEKHPVSECVSSTYMPFVSSACLEKYMNTDSGSHIPKQMRKVPVLELLSSSKLTV